MFEIYDIEVFKYDWVIVFKVDGKYRVFHNDVEELRAYVESNRHNIYVGFNNYHYDDKVLAGMLTGRSPYDLTNMIIVEGRRPRLKLNRITLDTIQELPMGVGLKSSQGNLGKSIVECPVPFDIDRPLTLEELLSVITYCKNDVDDTELLFKKREDYFSAKFEIVKEFNLPVIHVMKTRAILVSKVLKCHRVKIPHDRLHIDYDPALNWNLIPNEVTEFYQQVEREYRSGVPFEELERGKLKIKINGIEYIFGFGGIHGALPNYNGGGTFLQIDAKSFYPNLIINNNFMSRASSEPELYELIVKTRYALKDNKDPKEYIYKILINATFGAMKSEYNDLFDPKMANSICINGQLILLQLILELQDHVQIIQANTDGILVKYNNNYDEVMAIVNDFGKRFKLEFDADKIVKVAQRDVNNYAILFDNGKIKSKGRFSKYNGGSFEQNNLSIIDRALVNHYIHDIPVHQTVIQAYQDNDLAPFQIICKMGRTFDAMVYEYGAEGGTQYIETQHVNRVFATKDRKYWGIYKRKGESYTKIANTSEHSIIHNQSIETFDRNLLDLNYYIDLCTKNLY